MAICNWWRLVPSFQPVSRLFFSSVTGSLAMQDDVHLHRHSWHVQRAPRQRVHVAWMLLFSLLLTGCGGAEEGTSRVVTAAALTTAAQQASSRPGQPAAPGALPDRTTSPAPAATDGTAVPSLASPDLAQLSALPHLSSLSNREKAGLLMLLPSKSTSQRLELINMYPSLTRLPEVQKEVLLDKLEKIVPLTASQRPSRP